MAQQPSVNKPWRVLVPEGLYAKLNSHLFPGDGDEHGAVILAGIAETDHDVRLLAREVHFAADGRDYLPGKRGYRRLCAEFINDQVLKARDERLVYLAIHNHGGTNQVAFSGDDFRSHKRGYPALLQITRGMPVGALVFATEAIAGDIWISDSLQVPIDRATVVGRRRKIFVPRPSIGSLRTDPRYDHQVRLFGDRGQDILTKAKVAIVGLGGVGSLLAEILARLGVGNFVLIDPDRAESTNLPRLIGATRWDVAPRFLEETSWNWLRPIQRLLSRRKTSLALRNIRRANRVARVQVFASDLVEPDVAERLKDCDYIFLAADTMRARRIFNALVHQYLIPGVQIGAKVRSDKVGTVSDVYSVTRPVTPESGCLLCSRFINPTKLQEELVSDEERRVQRYVNDADVVAPSVITLNALAATQAANDFLFYMIGLTKENALLSYMYFWPLHRKVSWDEPPARNDCPDCGRSKCSRFAMGDGKNLPVKLRQSA